MSDDTTPREPEQGYVWVQDSFNPRYNRRITREEYAERLRRGQYGLHIPQDGVRQTFIVDTMMDRAMRGEYGPSASLLIYRCYEIAYRQNLGIDGMLVFTIEQLARVLTETQDSMMNAPAPQLLVVTQEQYDAIQQRKMAKDPPSPASPTENSPATAS